MNQNELMKFIEKRKTFLSLLAGRILRVEDSPLSLRAGFEKLLNVITEMEHGKELDIPGLIFTIDDLIIYCDCIKNQLIEIKWWVKHQHSYIYEDKED